MSKLNRDDAAGEPLASPPPRASHTVPQTGRPAAAPSLELTVEREAGVPVTRHLALDGDVLRLGSHPANELVLADPKVSSVHCQLRSSSTGWRIVDTSSLNGTRVGGVRIRDADITLPECRIEIGDSTVRVRAVPLEREALKLMPPSFGALYGTSSVMARLFERVTRVARSELDVLIEGENGTGKELIAAEIVRRSPRANKPLVIVDCGAISRQLMESELFGHVKGAFTGADRPRTGAFEAADGGTVFLDEIGELPLEMQPALLRAIAVREIRRVGENQVRKVDVRVIAATNRNLEREINEGRFREDLYFRLSVLRIDVPALRDRTEDLPLLVSSFLEELDATDKLDQFTPALLAEMRQHSWPGNVRELKNYVQRFLVFDEHQFAGERASVPPPTLEVGLDEPFRMVKDRVIANFERTYLQNLLTWAEGNVSRAARKARVDRMYLHKLLQRYGLRRGGSLVD